MKEEKILTLHPEGKQGVNISKEKYNTVKNAFIEVLKEKFEGSVSPRRSDPPLRPVFDSNARAGAIAVQPIKKGREKSRPFFFWHLKEALL